ncbi:hypothetical protein Afil01_47670 [Actinorhabdospora filicis]|uniref:SnoaL-like domain-containing protein n=1 Tax=Actinorhabdospora filicis TaxID=1785913 RepID=A0A9W6SN47_9ACTN|nr:nuclear transport factor 2 family protein [Actinorhabdospora filicis]GLZ79960.1 hypothetical protein Afil01_47670 [Actinorhabdospora filicis]
MTTPPTALPDTAEVIARFNAVFTEHDASGLNALIGEDCVMETVEPAPEGVRYIGRAACVAFWRALAEDRAVAFRPEQVIVAGEWATVRWRFRFGEGPSDYVTGVNVTRVRDGLIVESVGYSKTATAGSDALTELIDEGSVAWNA